jgi:hypothetical protein
MPSIGAQVAASWGHSGTTRADVRVFSRRQPFGRIVTVC